MHADHTIPSVPCLGGYKIAGRTTGSSPGPLWCPYLPQGGVVGLYLMRDISLLPHATTKGCEAHRSIAVFITKPYCPGSRVEQGELRRTPYARSSWNEPSTHSGE